MHEVGVNCMCLLLYVELPSDGTAVLQEGTGD